MTNSTIRFQVCFLAALLATVLGIAGVKAAAAVPAHVPATTLSTQLQFVGAGNALALR
jgi:hypothetical protein